MIEDVIRVIVKSARSRKLQYISNVFNLALYYVHACLKIVIQTEKRGIVEYNKMLYLTVKYTGHPITDHQRSRGGIEV
jgi:hypothetical protein